MKTARDTLLVVFVSLISITQLARCGASAILDDRDEETEELEELVRNEVFSSLQFLRENQDEDFQPPNYPKPRNGNQDPTRYYQVSNQNPPRKPQVSGNSYKIPEYSSSSSYYTGNSKPFDNQEARTNGDLKTGRSIDAASFPAVSSMNTREPDEYSTTITLPSLGGGRLFYGGGGYGAGSGYSGGGSYGGSGIYNGLVGAASRMRPSALLRRGINRLSRYGAGLGGGNGFRYGLGTGGLTGLLGGAGLQGMNLGFGGGAGGAGGGGSGGGYYADYSGDGVNLSGGGRRRYGNRRYGVQGDMSGSGGSWSVGGGDDGSPTEYYNLRYGYPGTSATIDGNSGGGGSRRYSVSYPNDATSTTVSSDGANPPQYELMFLRNQQNGSNQDGDLQLTAGSGSGANRDTNGAGYRLNVSGSAAPSSSSNPSGVEEYRVVVVNKDSPGNGSGRSGVSLTTAGSAPGGSGSGSWSVSSSGTSGSGSSGRVGQGGFQITTPITSTQVSIPPTSIVGSVLGTVQGAATGEQTRSLSNNPPAGKFIQVIPVKTSN